MKILSLSANIAGNACAVAYCIKNFYNNNYQTNFFDYLEISLLSIIQVLNEETIYDKINFNQTMITNKDNKESVYFNNFHKIISHHDLVNNYNNEEYIDFIEKYKRRHSRFLDTVKSENKIFFIRYGFEDYENIVTFMNKIKNINPNLEFFLINVNYDETNIQINYDIKNYIYINFYNINDKNIQYDDDLYFKTLQFNWENIFELIMNLK
jgi:hypothetical protein